MTVHRMIDRDGNDLEEYKRSPAQTKAWRKWRTMLQRTAFEHGIIWSELDPKIVYCIRNSFHEGWEQGYKYQDEMESVFPDLSKVPLLGHQFISDYGSNPR